MDDFRTFRDKYGEEKLWDFGGASTKALSMMVQHCAYMAGYDERYFSFHSLRAGMIV